MISAGQMVWCKGECGWGVCGVTGGGVHVGLSSASEGSWLPGVCMRIDCPTDLQEPPAPNPAGGTRD